MATVIALVLLFTVSYLAYRAGNREPGGTHRPACGPSSRHPPLYRTNPRSRPTDRAGDLTQAPSPPDAPPATAAPATPAEVREATLARQLLAGSVEPETYRRLMAELAHASPDQDASAERRPR